MPARTDALGQQYDDDVRIWSWMTGVSILCHVIFFSGVLFVPQLRFSKPYVFSSVEVDLVSLPHSQAGPRRGPEPVAAPKAEKKEALKPPEEVKPPAKTAEPEKPKEEPITPAEAKPEEMVSIAPKTVEIKKSMKQKTYDASKSIQSAIAKIEKEASQSRPHAVLDAIERLKKEDREAEGEGGVVMRGGVGAGGAGKGAPDLLDIYNAEIWHRIKKNWAFSEEVGRGRTDWEATIVVKIMRGGEIRDIWFETRSGNDYFDDSALKAVKKSDPLPPLPEAFRNPYLEVGFRFNLSELQR